MISKVIHFVWVGGDIPHVRLDRIYRWKQKNPNFTINLWIDEKGANINSIFGTKYSQAIMKIKKKVEEFKKLGIIIQTQDINKLSIDYKELYEFIRYEIDRLLPNYGAASDLIRLGILFKYGGAY